MTVAVVVCISPGYLLSASWLDLLKIINNFCSRLLSLCALSQPCCDNHLLNDTYATVQKFRIRTESVLSNAVQLYSNSIFYTFFLDGKSLFSIISSVFNLSAMFNL